MQDWDLIACSQDRIAPEDVSKLTDLRSEEYCLFIAKAEEFRRPWPRAKDSVRERGLFGGWQWTVIREGHAKYFGTADKSNRRGGWKPAFRIWRRT